MRLRVEGSPAPPEAWARETARDRKRTIGSVIVWVVKEKSPGNAA
jgi:hypothetical protein